QIAFTDSSPKPSSSRFESAAPAPSSESGLQQVRYQPVNNANMSPVYPEMMSPSLPGAAGVMPYGSPQPMHGMGMPGPMMVGPESGGYGPSGPGPIPTEKQKVSLPPYVIEPPDILLLNPIKLVPRPPYVVQPFDVLIVRVAEPLPNQPIEGTYTVLPDGTINLGYSYGLVRVGGLTLEEVER